MSGYFLDSSALVKVYVQEPGSNQIRAFLKAESVRGVYIARITHVEVVAALARRFRGSAQTLSYGQEAIRRFQEALARHLYNVIDISPDTFLVVAQLAERHCLRGYDAV